MPYGKYIYYDTDLIAKPSYKKAKVGETSSEFLVDLKGLRRYGAQPAGGWSAVAPDGAEPDCSDDESDCFVQSTRRRVGIISPTIKTSGY